MQEGDLAPEARIYRHEKPIEDTSNSPGDPELVEDVTRHVEAHIGPIATVFHELVSPLVHIDVHHVPPSPGFPFNVLVTSGMSEREMTTPSSVPDHRRRAELVINLPADWPIGEVAFEAERWYWPVRCLKTLARFPHQYATWLDALHTIPNGEPPAAYAASTRQCGMMIVPPFTLPEALHKLQRPNGQRVRFWNLLPLYREEMEFKLQNGWGELFKRLDASGARDIVNPDRVNTCA